MDPLLTSRYESFFQYYGIGGDPLVRQAKKQLISRMQKEPDFLRADGALFLLVNIDHMIIRPLSGYVPDRNSKLGDAMKQSMSTKRLIGSLRKSIDIILNDLQAAAKPTTAHAILKSIDKHWT